MRIQGYPFQFLGNLFMHFLEFSAVLLLKIIGAKHAITACRQVVKKIRERKNRLCFFLHIVGFPLAHQSRPAYGAGNNAFFIAVFSLNG